MKKTNKVLGLATMLLTVAGMVACGSNKPASSGPCKHSWKTDEAASVAATCTTEGKKVQKCELCGETKETKVNKTAHQYETVADKSKAATCTEGGVTVQACKVCKTEKTTEVEALGHDMVEGDVVEEATCTAAGVRARKCSRCEETDTVEIRALGHDYAEPVITKAATCTEDGAGTETCGRCGDVHEVTVEKLGHKVAEVDGDDTPAPEGEAKVRVYACQNDGCDEKYLGFRADEVTEESKSHIYIEEDGGARFLGRPIGNNLELDPVTGNSVNKTADELVFDETQTGDFFEYKFTLTAAQAATLATSKLYCDAKPADYMGQNGVDFWAYKEGDTDWTPGAYIDGEEKGQIIRDFRYILYVDGERQQLDADVKTPVARNNPRAEYVLPYTFKLHAGLNSIRLVMSGGYRSQFYNFTFRAVEEEPAPGPVDEACTHEFTFGDAAPVEGACAAATGKCSKCEHNAVKIMSGQDLNGNLAQDGKLPKGSNGYDGTKPASYKFNAPAAGKGTLLIEAAHDNKGNDARSFYDGKTGSANAFPLPDGATNTQMKLNGTQIILPTATYGELGLPSEANEFRMIEIGEVTYVSGLNELVVSAHSSYGLKFRSFIFVF